MGTIRKYLRADTVEPQFKAPTRPSQLDPFAEKLLGWLRIEAGKSRKQKRTVKQMHADLVALGYDGSYGRVAAFARTWKTNRQFEQQTSGRGTFVPLVFQSGEAFQFDWSEDLAVLGGERVKLQVAHTKLSHSKVFIVRADPLQTHEMLFDAPTPKTFRGVPRAGRSSPARDLRQHEDCGRPDRGRQDAAGQRPVRGDGQSLPVRTRVL